MIKELLPAIGFIILQVYTVAVTAYLTITGVLGFKNPKKLPDAPKTKRFLILVPAHNEEAVIDGIVQNLKGLDYPSNLYDVRVIADGCTDDTADKVTCGGCTPIVHTYEQEEIKGKPAAIRYALEQIPDYDTRYDAVCIFDADNLVSKNFLTEMNKHLHAGQKLVQCYLDTKNPMDNWVSLSFATNYYYMNRSFQLSRSHMNLPASLGGTGFCIETGLLKKIGWTATSLTEDLEFQIQSVLGGERAYWCHTARVYDEKPTSFKASCEQRSRWARGHWSLVFKFAPALLKKAIFERSITAWDTFFYAMNPLHIFLGGVTLIYTIIAMLAGFSLPYIIPGIVMDVLFFMPYAHMLYSILRDVKKPAKKLLGIITLTFFNFTYFPIVCWALVTRNNRVWKRTEHSRNVALDLELDPGEVKEKAS